MNCWFKTTSISTAIKPLQGYIQILKEDMKNVKEDVKNLNDDVKAIKTCATIKKRIIKKIILNSQI